MNADERLLLQSFDLTIKGLVVEIAKQRQEAQMKSRYNDLPEWIDLEQAISLKRGVSQKKSSAEGYGGASLHTYRQKLFLQPCCGFNYKLVGGRKCWKKDDVIEWLGITDEELKSYAEKRKVKLPDVYQKRSIGGKL
jgi:hypothetical protein